MTIVGLETVLAETDGSYRDPELYYLTIFGEPGAHRAAGAGASRATTWL